MKWAQPEKVEVKTDFSFPSSTTQRLKREGGGCFYTVGLHVARWIESNCLLTAAQYAGQPFRLLPWQWRALAELFEVVRTPEGWKLKHRWTLIGLPKKNGKSELIGALALFFLLGTDEIDPRIFVAASTDDQANMVFAPVAFIAKKSPSLSPLVTVKNRIVVSKTERGGFVRRLAAVAGANDGANVYVALLDEFHEWTGEKGEAVWNVITNGTVMRDEPMIIQITTAGFDQESKCYEWYESGCAIRDGKQEDPGYYFLWFDAPEEMDYKDPNTWRIANPSFGLIMQEDFYADQLLRKPVSVFCRYFVNRWMEAEDLWDVATIWDDLKGDTTLDPKFPTFVGIDIGRKNDHSAVVITQWHDNGIIKVNQKIWSNPYPVSDQRYREWRMNIYDVDNYCREIFNKFPEPSGEDAKGRRLIAGPAFFYDPHLYGGHADALKDDGLNMVEFNQSDAKMVPASQRLYEWTMARKLVHDGDSSARAHIRSVTAKEKERGWRISKITGSNRHVDFAIALAMALFGCVELMSHEETKVGGVH